MLGINKRARGTSPGETEDGNVAWHDEARPSNATAWWAALALGRMI